VLRHPRRKLPVFNSFFGLLRWGGVNKNNKEESKSKRKGRLGFAFDLPPDLTKPRKA